MSNKSLLWCWPYAILQTVTTSEIIIFSNLFLYHRFQSKKYVASKKNILTFEKPSVKIYKPGVIIVSFFREQ